MEKIKYITGDATDPQAEGQKIIVHVCNNVGAWGAGFVMALSNKWKEPEAAYRAQTEYNLGEIDIVHVEDDIAVCNMIGQENTIGRNNNASLPPIRYVAIEYALKQIVFNWHFASMNTDKPFSIHMPRIGSGLAGGNWNIIEAIIEETLCKAGIEVTVYDLP